MSSSLLAPGSSAWLHCSHGPSSRVCPLRERAHRQGGQTFSVARKGRAGLGAFWASHQVVVVGDPPVVRPQLMEWAIALAKICKEGWSTMLEEAWEPQQLLQGLRLERRPAARPDPR